RREDRRTSGRERRGGAGGDARRPGPSGRGSRLVKTLPLLLLLALPQPQDKGQDPKLPKEPIRDWKYQLKDVRKVPVPNSNPPQFTSVEEVTLILAGDEAVPVNVEKKIFDLRGVKASYFTEPEKDKHSKEIRVQSDRGRFDNE